MSNPHITPADIFAEWAEERQSEACRLSVVIEAADTLAREKLEPLTVMGLLDVARKMAEDLNDALDLINLPKGGDA